MVRSSGRGGGVIYESPGLEELCSSGEPSQKELSDQTGGVEQR